MFGFWTLTTEDPDIAHFLLEELDALYRTARYLTGDAQMAEDIVHDVVVKALKHRDKVRPGGSVRAWLFAILRNTVIDYFRRRGREFRTVSLEELPESNQSLLCDPVDVRILDNMLDEEIVEALNRLPEEMRLAVLLADVEGFSYKEIAEALQWPPGTVMSRLYRGRQKLRQYLREYAERLGYHT